MYGVVKHVRLDKGYGFVTGTDGCDRFFHLTHVVGGHETFATLRTQTPVEFEAVLTPRGPAARAVRLTPVRASARLIDPADMTAAVDPAHFMR